MHNLLLCFAFVGSISAKRQVQMSMAKWMTEQKYRLLMVAILHEERERERQTKRGESYARQLMIVFNCWKLTLLCRIEKWIRRTRNYEDKITSWTAGRRRVLATRFLVAPGAVPLSLSVYLPPSFPPLRATLITFNVVDFHELRRREEGNMLETTWVWVTVFVFFSYLVSPFPNSLLCSPCVVVTSLGTLSLSPSPPHALTLVRYCFLSASAAKGPATPTRAHCKDSRML